MGGGVISISVEIKLVFKRGCGGLVVEFKTAAGVVLGLIPSSCSVI